MTKYTTRMTLLFFLGLLPHVVGCDGRESPKSPPATSIPTAVGREYGETLQGAINQANDVNDKLERAGEELQKTRSDQE